MKKTDFVKQGKKNRASGARFELKVRHDLEEKGWVVSKWMNQVDLKYNIVKVDLNYGDDEKGIIGKALNSVPGKLIPAKHKFCGFGRPMAIGTGFPDFVTFKVYHYKDNMGFDMIVHTNNGDLYEVIGVECKSNGYLKPEEKEKCKWLLSEGIFSKILIASKGEKRGEIKYIEFK